MTNLITGSQQRIYGSLTTSGIKCWYFDIGSSNNITKVCINNNILYFSGYYTNEIFALDVSGGPYDLNSHTLLWNVTSSVYDGNLIVDEYCVDDNYFYISFKGAWSGIWADPPSQKYGVIAYNNQTGEEVWRYVKDDNTYKTYVLGCKLFNNVIIFCVDGRVFALDSITGNELWISNYVPGTISYPELVNNIIYTTSFTNSGTYLNAINFLDGSIIFSNLICTNIIITFRFACLGNVGTICGYESSLYNTTLIAFNLSNGVELWRVPINSYNESYMCPAINSNYIYISMYGNGYTACYNIDDGSLIWDTTIGTGSWCNPVVYNDSLFVVSYNTKNVFISLNRFNGDTLWTTAIPQLSIGQITINNNDEYIYTGSNNGIVIAIGNKCKKYVKISPITELILYVKCNDRLYVYNSIYNLTKYYNINDRLKCNIYDPLTEITSMDYFEGVITEVSNSYIRLNPQLITISGTAVSSSNLPIYRYIDEGSTIYLSSIEPKSLIFISSNPLFYEPFTISGTLNITVSSITTFTLAIYYKYYGSNSILYYTNYTLTTTSFTTVYSQSITLPRYADYSRVELYFYAGVSNSSVTFNVDITNFSIKYNCDNSILINGDCHMKSVISSTNTFKPTLI